MFDATNLAPPGIREDLKPECLSFTDIAKRAGEQWQVLPIHIKASYETQASTAKDKYCADLDSYKTTQEYRLYNDYLADFKLKHNVPRPVGNSFRTSKAWFPRLQVHWLIAADEKRPKFEKELSTQSSPSPGSQDEGNELRSGHTSPIVSNVPRALPSSFSGPSQFKSHSPLSGSPPVFFARQASSASQSRKPSQLHVPIDTSFPDLNSARMSSLENKEPRSSSNHLVSQLQNHKMGGLRGGGSPPTTMYNVHHDSMRSSNSSPTSSGVSSTMAATPSSHTSLAVDHRVPITLPPLSLLGLKGRDNVDLFPTGKSPSAQPLPYLNPSFNPSNIRRTLFCFSTRVREHS